MKLISIICEFNPFHNGHKYLLDKVKNDCDAVICIMSGNFTQRGEMCILDKYARAKHAIACGADAVLQLPASFAVAPAEIFADGAVKILSAVPDVAAIAFGCESGDANAFTSSARLLISENAKFKSELAARLADGESYIKSYAAAFAACGGDLNFISSPNNVLGLEYTKAVLRRNSHLSIIPVKRKGAGYNDAQLKDNFSSASAIRKNIGSDKIKDNVPDCVYGDLKTAENYNSEFESFARNALFTADRQSLKRIYGCGEGLENNLKALENSDYSKIVEGATSKRYPSSRIRRILCANALKLYADDTRKFSESDLYIKPLAVKKDRADEILSALARSEFPLITGVDADKLTGSARQCFLNDRYEFAVYNHLTCSDKKDYMILV